jgi:hypothetical protein
MTKSQVEAVLPDVLPAVRSWVAGANSRADAPIDIAKQRYSQSRGETARQ